ncbi:MAG: J domain-containing protein [Puniceicoccales bacterium]|nr:J domain-containing protein [Puniceicoccales bacterium]
MMSSSSCYALSVRSSMTTEPFCSPFAEYLCGKEIVRYVARCTEATKNDVARVCGGGVALRNSAFGQALYYFVVIASFGLVLLLKYMFFDIGDISGHNGRLNPYVAAVASAVRNGYTGATKALADGSCGPSDCGVITAIHRCGTCDVLIGGRERIGFPIEELSQLGMRTVEISCKRQEDIDLSALSGVTEITVRSDVGTIIVGADVRHITLKRASVECLDVTSRGAGYLDINLDSFTSDNKVFRIVTGTDRHNQGGLRVRASGVWSSEEDLRRMRERFRVSGFPFEDNATCLSGAERTKKREEGCAHSSEGSGSRGAGPFGGVGGSSSGQWRQFGSGASGGSWIPPTAGGGANPGGGGGFNGQWRQSASGAGSGSGIPPAGGAGHPHGGGASSSGVGGGQSFGGGSSAGRQATGGTGFFGADGLWDDFFQNGGFFGYRGRPQPDPAPRGASAGGFGRFPGAAPQPLDEIDKACKVIGISEEDAMDSEKLKRAFKEKALKWHPDKNSNTPEATEKFQRLNAANALLRKHFGHKK